MENKKLNALFDMCQHLYEGKKENFKIGDKELSPVKLQAFVAKQIHEAGISGAKAVDGSTKAIQAFTGSTDLSKVMTNVWNGFQEEPNYDTFWQAAFRSVPLRKGQLEWTIGTVQSGVALKILEEGTKVDYAGITGDTIKGSVDLYGSGLSLSWHTMEGRDLASFYTAMTDFRAKRMTEYADIHYGLLATAATNEQITYQGDTTDTTLDRDIKTLTEGYNTIGEACKDLGFGDTANARMICFVSPKLRQRLNQAMRVTSADMARSGNQGQVLDSNIDIFYTYNSSIPTDKVIMVLPGNKIQNSVYMQEKSFERTDPDNLNFLKSSFTAFGAVVGENAQTAELAFA